MLKIENWVKIKVKVTRTKNGKMFCFIWNWIYKQHFSFIESVSLITLNINAHHWGLYHVFQGKFTTKSDVWSLGVTLWEILTFARDQPYDTMSDEQVIENAGHYYRADGKQAYLRQPNNCPKEIYDLMLECWNRAESERPSFREIQMFLQRKNMGYNPKDEKMSQIKVPVCWLTAPPPTQPAFKPLVQPATHPATQPVGLVDYGDTQTGGHGHCVRLSERISQHDTITCARDSHQEKILNI